MTVLYYIIYIVIAYFIGAFPFMLLLSRARGYDLSNEPDYHIAMYRKVGRKEGMSGFVVDFLKGILTVLAGYLLGFPLAIVGAASLVVVCGQMWPVFQKFDGEKGNTTGGGAIATITLVYNAGWVLVVGLIIVITGFLIRTVPRFMRSGQTWDDRLKLGGPVSNSFPLAILIGFGAMPLTSALLGYAHEITLTLLAIYAAIIIRRLTAGVRKDVREKKSTVKRILFNRLLFDRSYYRGQE